MSAITDKTLLENFLNLIPAGVFWKDKDRRFLGANQMFLDYYPNQKQLKAINPKQSQESYLHPEYMSV